MCFYIPKEFQSNPPKPAGNGVYLSRKSMDVFALKQSGFPNTDQMVGKFKDKLKKFSNMVDFSFYVWMGYDRFKETVDVMFVKTQQKQQKPLEQAPFQVIKKFDVSFHIQNSISLCSFLSKGFEERQYPSVMWVCSKSGEFMDLFGYISGNNEKSKKSFRKKKKKYCNQHFLGS